MTGPLIPVIKPISGVAGNTGIKYEKRRPDFDSRKFDALIEQKGYRLAWTPTVGLISASQP